MSENKMEQEKLTYEQLEQAANQLLAQNNELRKVLIETSNAMRRLDYLFKVLDHVHLFDDDFVEKCITEIKQLMTLPEVKTNTPSGEITE